MANKATRSKALTRRATQAARTAPRALLADLRQLISEARQTVARGVNAALVLLYWEVGRRIGKEILKNARATYGEEIVSALSTQLTAEFGGSFTDKNLWRMVQFAEVYADQEIVVSLIRQLTWTHFLALIPLKDSLQRDFYAELCRVERWTVRTLRDKIRGMLFERTALSKKPAALARKELAKLRDEDQLTPDLVFRDPYVLDFLRLKDTYSEEKMNARSPEVWRLPLRLEVVVQPEVHPLHPVVGVVEGEGGAGCVLRQVDHAIHVVGAEHHVGHPDQVVAEGS